MDVDIKDVRAKRHVWGSNDTIQTTIKEEEATVRAAVTAKKDIKMNETEAGKAVNLAKIDCDKEIAVLDLGLTAVKKVELEGKKVAAMTDLSKKKIETSLKVYGMDHNERMKKIESATALYTKQMEGNLDVYGKDHEARMKVLENEHQMAMENIKKKGAKGLKFKRTSLQQGMQQPKFGNMSAYALMGSMGGGANGNNQPGALMYGSNQPGALMYGSNQPGALMYGSNQPQALMYGNSNQQSQENSHSFPVQQADDSDSDDLGVDFDEKLMNVEADMEKDERKHQQTMAKINTSHAAHMAQLTKTSEQMEHERKMMESQVELMKLQLQLQK